MKDYAAVHYKPAFRFGGDCMPHSADRTLRQYDRDDITNDFLLQYPIHCEFRTGEMRRKKLHFHEGYEIYICLGGAGSYIVEDKLYPLHAGTLTIIAPRVVHHPHSKEGAEFSRYILSVSKSYLDRIESLCPAMDRPLDHLLTNHSAGVHYFLSAAQLERARSACAELADLLESPDPLREIAVLNRITGMLHLIGELRDDPQAQQIASSKHEHLINEIVAYMTSSYRERITIDGLLERFPVSRSQLLHLFKATTGFTVNQFLTEYRLNKAEWLLADTDLPMTEIATESGFGDLSHFYHLFRRANGMTPRQYRRKTTGRQ